MSLPESLPPTIPSIASQTPFKSSPDPLVSHISFKVQFGAGMSYKKIAPNSFSFHGKGALVIGGQDVHISGKRHRSFWFGVPEKHDFLQSDITNARAVGRYVRFEVKNPSGASALQVGFIARSRKEAEKIVGLLPRQQTEAFTQERAELEEYQQRLTQLTPHAWVTPTIVGINVLIFVLMCLNGVGIFSPDARMAIHWGSNFGPLTIIDRQWWRLLSSTFVHFGLLHLALNMLALYQSGRLVERIFGSMRFAALYLFAGLTGSLVSVLWHPLVNSAGASGAIFGVFGGLLVFMLNPRNAVPRTIMNEHRYSTTTFIAYNLLNGFTHNGIDNGAHIGGLLGGMAMGYLLARPLNEITPGSMNIKRNTVAATLGLLVLGLLTYQLDRSKEQTAKAVEAAVQRAQDKAPNGARGPKINN
jgi:rhomboid protease GluP